MIRSFFVDCVIVFAMCLVVWGVAPALVAQNPPPGALTDPTYHNRCCRWGEFLGLGGGNNSPCTENQEDDTKHCKNPGEKNCSGSTRTCVCRNWRLKQPGNNYSYFCACS